MKRFGLANSFKMMGVALLLERCCVIVNRQTVTDQHAGKVGTEQVGQHTTSPALINQIKGVACINEDPQPPTRSADPPASLIAVNHSCLAQFFNNGLILALYFGSESIQRLGKPTGTQLQVETIAQDEAGFSHREPLSFVQISGQGQGAGSELDTGGAGGQRHLQRMAGMDILTTASTGGLVSNQPCHMRTHQRNIFDKLFDPRLSNKVSGPAVRTSTELGFNRVIDMLGLVTKSAEMSMLASGRLGR